MHVNRRPLGAMKNRHSVDKEKALRTRYVAVFSPTSFARVTIQEKRETALKQTRKSCQELRKAVLSSGPPQARAETGRLSSKWQKFLEEKRVSKPEEHVHRSN